jgi:signal transduction histidine kinase
VTGRPGSRGIGGLIGRLRRSWNADPVPEGFGARPTPDLRRLDRPVGAVLAAASLATAVAATVASLETRSVVAAWLMVAIAITGLVLQRAMTSHVAFAAMCAVALGWSGDSMWLPATTMLGLTVVTVALTSSRHGWSIIRTSAIAFAAPVIWMGDEGFEMSLGFATVTALASGFVAAVESEAIHLALTSKTLFENAPIAIMEQDWSATQVELAVLKRAGVSDISEYLHSHPSEVGRLFSTAKLIAANAEAVKVIPVPPEPGCHEPDVIDEVNFEGNVGILTDMFHGRFDRTALFPLRDIQGAIRWHQAMAFAHPHGKGRVVVMSMDITELKDAKEALEELHISKDRFVASIAHELRTPLAAVVGFTSELLERPDAMSEQERREALVLANEQAMEAANIIADLLVAARADIGGVLVNHDSIDIEAEIDRVLSAQQESMPVVVVDDPPAICADSRRIHQVLRNLLTNSSRYGGPDRRLVVSVDADVVAVEVRDNGQELTDEKMEQLFEPYARAHEAIGITESVGLGLTVSRQLATAMGGSLQAFRDGPETVFRLELPVWKRCPHAGIDGQNTLLA